MKHVKQLLLAAAFAAGLSGPALAQQASSAQASAPAAAEMTEGEIRKVDKSAGKITVKHGEIKSIDMPPMTMVFRVKNAEMLEAVKAGDKVKFDAQKEGGQYVVTRIERAK